MKRFMKLAAVAFVVVLGSSWQNDASAQEPYDYDAPYDAPYSEDEVSYQTFYDELSPHGRWVDHPDHGYIWIPNAGPDFRPYGTSGHWVWTEEYEWMWVSDYDWGWAPFHYGRWDSDPYYGWYWVPGYEWSPAWVAWRDGGDYYGWAPLRPGISINVNFSIGSYSPPYDFWCFTPRRYIAYRNVWDHCLDRRRNVTIINHTTIINNYNYRGNIWRTGPRRVDVEIYAGRITPVRFRPASRPGRSIFRNNEVNIYRPQVRRDNDRRFTPRSVERYDRQRANDNRIGRNDSRFDRNNRRIEGNNNRFERNNRNNDNNRRFDRNDVRVQGNENNRRIERNPSTNPGVGNNNNRRIERNDNNGFERRRMEAPERNRNAENDRRVFRQQQGTNSNNDGRRFERRMERNEQPVMRQPQQQQQQRREIRTQENRQFSPQRQPQQQQPARQFERRDNSRQGGEQGGGNGRGRGRGRGRD